MAITARQEPSRSRPRSALDGLWVALPLSAAMWGVIVAMVEVLR